MNKPDQCKENNDLLTIKSTDVKDKPDIQCECSLHSDSSVTCPLHHPTPDLEQKVLERFRKEFAFQEEEDGPYQFTHQLVLTADIEQFILSVIHEVQRVERDRAISLATPYINTVAPQLKAEMMGLSVHDAVKISEFHKARWVEFINSLSNK